MLTVIFFVLKVPPFLLLDPNELCRHLPLIKETNQKLIPAGNNASEANAALVENN